MFLLDHLSNDHPRRRDPLWVKGADTIPRPLLTFPLAEAAELGFLDPSEMFAEQLACVHDMSFKEFPPKISFLFSCSKEILVHECL